MLENQCELRLVPARELKRQKRTGRQDARQPSMLFTTATNYKILIACLDALFTSKMLSLVVDIAMLNTVANSRLR